MGSFFSLEMVYVGGTCDLSFPNSSYTIRVREHYGS